MRRALSWSVSVAALLYAWAAIADEKPKGTFAFAGTQICLWAPQGFRNDTKGNPVIANGNTFQTSNNFWGLTTYNDDGTGKTTGTFSGIAGGAEPSGSGGIFTFQFTTSSIANNSYTTIVTPNTYKGTQTAGTRAGQTFTIDASPTAHLISNDKKIITNANAAPYVENITYSGGPNPGTIPRICNVANVAFRLN